MKNFKNEFIKETIDKFGFMPAPWVYLPNCHPYSIGWRMGGGESYMMYFFDWVDEQNWSNEEKADYFKKQDVPPAWLMWVYEVLFSIEDSDFDLPETERMTKYRPALKELGFKDIDLFETDFNSEKWK